MAYSFPEEVLEHVFSFLESERDRNSVSLVCKTWYEMERWCRKRIFIGNCYAVSPRETIRRFPEAKSIELKGKPHFADFNLVPEGWGGNLRVLDLQECDVEDLSGHWLSHFPDSFTSLETLNIACLGSEVSFSALERLVARSPNLKTLRLNRTVPLEKLSMLLQRAPQLVEFGTGSYSADIRSDEYSSLADAFSACKNLQGLSGFWDVVPAYLPAFYSVCSQLTSLNLSYATTQSPDLTKIVSQCHKLQRLMGCVCKLSEKGLWALVSENAIYEWICLNYIEDTGLNALAMSCKDLRELRLPKTSFRSVFLSTNDKYRMISIARNRPNFTCFRLCILEPRAPDHLTLEPLDVGFGAIVENCKDLRRLSMSGLLTDRVFEYIGKHAKKLDMLSIAFAGESDLGLHHVLSGCDSLRKLEIRDCPFGDKALLANASKLETMRSLWMSSCGVSFGACKLLGRMMPSLNVEVIDERENLNSVPENVPVEKLYIYRTVAGQRFDMPDFVRTMGKDEARDSRTRPSVQPTQQEQIQGSQQPQPTPPKIICKQAEYGHFTLTC
ncbi:transport inhibitor response 1-like protein [Tanacetum coccineum]